jgi:hypothetical protein
MNDSDIVVRFLGGVKLTLPVDPGSGVGVRALRRELLVERHDLLELNLERLVSEIVLLPPGRHVLLQVDAELHLGTSLYSHR